MADDFLTSETIDNLRHNFESDVEWRLRKRFLLAHCSDYPRPRLLCLASCLINIECYGATYPEEVMSQVRELSQCLGDELQHHRQRKLQQFSTMKFVQAAPLPATNMKPNKIKPTSGQLQGPKSVSDYTDLSPIGKDEFIRMFKGLIMVAYCSQSDSSALQIIFSKNKMNFISNIKKTDNDSHKCELIVNGCLITRKVAETGKAAKEKAASALMGNLKNMCWTIEVLGDGEFEKPSLQVQRKTCSEGKMNHEAIQESNVGNRLMRMMGWTGGGLGSKGQGIEAPISVDGAVNRAGLGAGSGSVPVQKLKKLIHDYAASDRIDELYFSADFTKEERAEIHKFGRQFHLKTTSRGKGEKRQLTVSRQLSIKDLFLYIQKNGGKIGRYVTVPPKISV